MTAQHSSTAVYFVVFAVLMVLLVLTVAVALVPLGAWGVVVALTIAFLKMLLVLAYFMHLRDEIGLVRLFAVAGLLWLMILFTFLMSDYLTRSDVLRA